MKTPWMLITGCTIIGWLLPEVMVAFGKIRQAPTAMNIFSATACGLIAASFVV